MVIDRGLRVPKRMPVIVSYTVEDWAGIQTTGVRKVTLPGPIAKPK